MSKQYKIIESPTEPLKENWWLNNGVVKRYGPSGWETIGGGSNSTIPITEEELKLKIKEKALTPNQQYLITDYDPQYTLDLVHNLFDQSRLLEMNESKYSGVLYFDIIVTARDNKSLFLDAKIKPREIQYLLVNNTTEVCNIIQIKYFQGLKVSYDKEEWFSTNDGNYYDSKKGLFYDINNNVFYATLQRHSNEDDSTYYTPAEQIKYFGASNGQWLIDPNTIQELTLDNIKQFYLENNHTYETENINNVILSDITGSILLFLSTEGSKKSVLFQCNNLSQLDYFEYYKSYDYTIDLTLDEIKQQINTQNKLNVEILNYNELKVINYDLNFIQNHIEKDLNSIINIGYILDHPIGDFFKDTLLPIYNPTYPTLYKENALDNDIIVIQVYIDDYTYNPSRYYRYIPSLNFTYQNEEMHAFITTSDIIFYSKENPNIENPKKFYTLDENISDLIEEDNEGLRYICKFKKDFNRYLSKDKYTEAIIVLDDNGNPLDESDFPVFSYDASGPNYDCNIIVDLKNTQNELICNKLVLNYNPLDYKSASTIDNKKLTRVYNYDFLLISLSLNNKQYTTVLMEANSEVPDFIDCSEEELLEIKQYIKEQVGENIIGAQLFIEKDTNNIYMIDWDLNLEFICKGETLYYMYYMDFYNYKVCPKIKGYINYMNKISSIIQPIQYDTVNFYDIIHCPKLDNPK